VNLYLAKRLKIILEEAGARCVLTRTEDSNLLISERIEIAKRSRGDIFLSLHNSSAGPSDDPLTKRGTSVYYYYPQSAGLARAIYNNLLEITPSPNFFGNKELDMGIIQDLPVMPCVRIEALFMSHPEDEMLLMNESFLNSFAKAICDGLVNYLGTLK
jgi:N-acetylmuramoyl-L-alanine amidase